MRSPRGFSVKYTPRVNILRRGLRGSHHIHVAADTDTLFTLHEPAQILRQVERATKVFSQYPPPRRTGEGGRVENEERNRVGRCESAKGSIRNTVALLLVEKEEGGRKEGGGAGAGTRAKGIRALRTSRSLQTLGGNVHACYYIPRLNRKLSSQTSSGEARCAITLPSFKLLSRRVTYVTALARAICNTPPGSRKPLKSRSRACIGMIFFFSNMRQVYE